MTIKEVEEKLNITRANIRFYEREGLLDPKRTDNKYRDYSEKDIERLEKILLFRKCNVSLENIRLIFNEEKSVDEVFKEQIGIIENEVKQLEGAKIICEKLAQEHASIEQIDTEKYMNLIDVQEQKGNKFKDISEDYIFATEKLYQSIIEDKELNNSMKKGIRIGLYVASAALLFIFLILFDYLFDKKIDWTSAIIFTAIFTIIDIIGVKKHIENKNSKRFSRKQNIHHFIITIIIMILAFFGYYSIKQIHDSYNINDMLVEMSVKNTLIDLAHSDPKNGENLFYGETHQILGSQVKNDEIYVYVVARYGIFDANDLKPVYTNEGPLTIIYKNTQTKSGTYALKNHYNTIPHRLVNKSKVNFEDTYFKSQLKSYSN